MDGKMSHDWVISRQLWWVTKSLPGTMLRVKMYVGEEAPEGDGWKQDEDVLDTWFSSALWPFSTMGWPDVEAEDFKRYFPTSNLGYRLRHHLLLGFSYDLPIIGIHRTPTI